MITSIKHWLSSGSFKYQQFQTEDGGTVLKFYKYDQSLAEQIAEGFGGRPDEPFGGRAVFNMTLHQVNDTVKVEIDDSERLPHDGFSKVMRFFPPFLILRPMIKAINPHMHWEGVPDNIFGHIAEFVSQVRK